MTAGEYARQARQVLAEIKLRQPFADRRRRHRTLPARSARRTFPRPAALGRVARALARTRPRNADRTICTEFCSRLDRAAAEKIHANDIPKLIRAIEVCLASRQKMTDLWQQGRDPLRGFRILRLGLDPDRAALYDRINRRAQQMFETGLDRRNAAVCWRNTATTRRPLASLGYKQAVQFLARRTHPRAGPASRTAGPPQLRQAPDDLVPPRAGRDLAEGLRRRCQNSAAKPLRR